MQKNIVEPIIIAIAGRSASGKSTIAQTLAEYSIQGTPVICQDWYYKTTLCSEKSEHNWDAPDSFDNALVTESLDNWRLKGTMTPRHDYVKCEMIPNVEFVKPGPVLIFEGLYAIRAIANRSDPVYKIYVDCDADIALARRLKRDVVERGRTVESVLDQYEKFVKPMHDKFVSNQRAHADLIIPNNTSAITAVEMIIPFLNSLH